MRILLLITLVTIAIPRKIMMISIIPEFITNKKIKILSNFTSPPDRKFFEFTFPWLASNFPNLEVEYYFKEGEAGGKRMCAVGNIKSLQWQADFLQCQAKGEEDCKEEQYVQQRAYNRCTQQVYLQMRDADNAFRKYKPLYTPFIVDGWLKITSEDPMSILAKMCSGISWVKPAGCKQPSPPPDLKDKSKSEEKSKPLPKSEDKGKNTENKDEKDSDAKAEPDDDAKGKQEPSKDEAKELDAEEAPGESAATPAVATA